MQIPSPGAECPAIVALPLIEIDFSRWIVPETAKTIILGTFDSAASLNLPGPFSLRLVTMKTFPPLQPLVYFPKPSAPGKAIALSGSLAADTVFFD